MNPLTILGLTVALVVLLALALAVALGAHRLQRINGLILAPIAVIGVTLYGVAYMTGAQNVHQVLNAALRSVLSACAMFAGRSDLSAAMGAAPWIQGSPFYQTLFFLVHMSALFVLAGALLSTLGQKAAQALWLFLTPTRSVYLYFGLHEQSVALGRDIATTRKWGEKHLFISLNPDPSWQRQVLAFGGIVRQEPYLRGGRLNETLLRRLGIKAACKKDLSVFALDDEEGMNIDIAGAAVAYCEENRISHERVRILLRSRGELDYSQLDRFIGTTDGIYSVDAFSEAELSARLLVRESPPCKAMEFHPDGRAAEDFCALILGFGQVGQQALRQVVMNGQFPGSRFSALVVDRGANDTAGQFERRYAGMVNAYDIRFCEMDIRSRAFYALLDDLVPRVKYIVVALGTDDANYEATADLERYYTRIGVSDTDRPSILVSVCNKRVVETAQHNIRFVDQRSQLYTGDILLRGALDGMAQAVNLSYVLPGEGAVPHARDLARSEWDKLSYFDRESNRASAEFIPAMLRMAGVTMEEARDARYFGDRVTNRPDLLENLSVAEHLRWNAFHFAMGYTLMTEKELSLRGEAQAHPDKSIRKDTKHLRHACLVDWEELDALSLLMERLTGEPVDYKEMDRQNIRQIPRTLSFIPNQR